MHSSESPVHGDQEGSAWNGHFQSKRRHPLFVFNQFGDLGSRCALRPGNVHSAEAGKTFRTGAGPLFRQARPSIMRRRFRADAAFAVPALFDLLVAAGWDDAVRIKSTLKLHERIGSAGEVLRGPACCITSCATTRASMIRAQKPVSGPDESWPRPSSIPASCPRHRLHSSTKCSLPNERGAGVLQ